MSLQTFERGTFEGASPESAAAPTASSMRFMEAGLAFVALLVALLLNLGR